MTTRHPLSAVLLLVVLTGSSAVGMRPVYAVNGGQDRLFPSEQMRPFFEQLEDAGCDLAWKPLLRSRP